MAVEAVVSVWNIRETLTSPWQRHKVHLCCWLWDWLLLRPSDKRATTSNCCDCQVIKMNRLEAAAASSQPAEQTKMEKTFHGPERSLIDIHRRGEWRDRLYSRALSRPSTRRGARGYILCSQLLSYINIYKGGFGLLRTCGRVGVWTWQPCQIEPYTIFCPFLLRNNTTTDSNCP